MKALVGYTGFVGGNIYASAGNEIDCVFNSKNITMAYGVSPDILIYAGLRAEKYLANSEPDKDRELIIQAEENIEKINPKKIVLISTIDVFKTPADVDESTDIDCTELHPYGYNRYMLERWVTEKYPDSLIIRLPGLFGRKIKKNFIYDYINVIPSMIKKSKFEDLLSIDHNLKNYYIPLDNGFYKLNAANEDREPLKEKFIQLGFTALNFTDSRSVYQFYNLAHLWDDMNYVLNSGIKVWHPATEPVSAGEIYKYLTGDEFINELNGVPAKYNYKTLYYKLFGGEDGYIRNKEQILSEIKRYIDTRQYI